MRKAGKTAGPIGLKFFEDTHGGPWGVIGLIKFKIFIFNIFPRATLCPSASTL